MTRGHGRRAGEDGFTLIELLVVVGILALLAAVTVPALTRPSDGVRLKAAVGELLAALRQTRAVAIARNASVAVVIDAERRTIEPPVRQSVRLSPDIDLKLTIAAPERQTPSRGGFRFFADGSSTGGNIALMLNGRQADICVDWLTGRARPARQC